jgi:release factor glutamine methyltransferase
MTSVAAALAAATARLRAAGVAAPRRDAQILLMHALGLSRDDVMADAERPLAAGEIAAFDVLVDRRVGREPISHIIGMREFWSLPFRVTSSVLDPRPDSETVVDAVLDRVPDRAPPYRVLDLGTGSGCLLLALLHELPAATGLGVDQSVEALAIARENADRLGLGARADFRVNDWADGLSERFDIVISNPPYVAASAVAALAPEVARYEPRLALDGGVDGLDAYRILAPQLARLVRPSGCIAIEVGSGQEAKVAALCRRAGLIYAGSRKDLAGVVRCLLFTASDVHDCQPKKTVGIPGTSD